MAFDGRLLAGVSVLAAAVEGGSFVRAADTLGLSASGVSRAIARLEARLGIRLFDRTTRSLKLTDAGARFYRDVGPLLEGIDDAAGAASGSAAVVRGRLRINVDPFFARLMLAPRLAELSKRYPELELELLTRDGIGDLIAEGVDLALRFGPPPGASPVARLLLKTRILTVASPGISQAPRHAEDAGRSRWPCLYPVSRSPDRAAVSLGISPQAQGVQGRRQRPLCHDRCRHHAGSLRRRRRYRASHGIRRYGLSLPKQARGTVSGLAR